MKSHIVKGSGQNYDSHVIVDRQQEGQACFSFQLDMCIEGEFSHSLSSIYI
jgi:hypothetical protein